MAAAMALAAATIALAVAPVAAVPRCKVLGWFQAQPMVFECGGSAMAGPEARTNLFEYRIAASSEEEIVIVPKGTVDFAISMSPKHGMQSIPAELEVEDLSDGSNLRSKMQKKALPPGNQDNLYEYEKDGVTYQLWEVLAYPRSQRLVVNGTLPDELRIKAKNKLSDPLLLVFKHYQYAPYEKGSMCGYGKQPDGCYHYAPMYVRDAAAAWCSRVMSMYSDQDKAWEAFAGSVEADLIPYYDWHDAYKKVGTIRHPLDVWRDYKFLSQGGFEVGAPGVSHADFEFCYALPKMNMFAKECCDALKQKYTSGEDVFQKTGTGNTFKFGIWETCKNLPNAPAYPQYYERYLDADGYQGVMPHDIQYCWTPFTTLPPPDLSRRRRHGGQGGGPGGNGSIALISTTEPVPETTPIHDPDSCTHLVAPAKKGDQYLKVFNAFDMGIGSSGQKGTNVTIGGVEETQLEMAQMGSILVAKPIGEDYGLGIKICRETHKACWAACRSPACKDGGSWNGGLKLVDGKCTSRCSRIYDHEGTLTRHCGPSSAKDYTTAGSVDCTGCQAQETAHLITTTEPASTPLFSTTELQPAMTTPDPGPHLSCHFTPADLCATTFTYKGTAYNGCTTVDHVGGGWCSADAVYEGRWHRCTWDCVSSQKCSWKPIQECLPKFSFDGHEFGPCTKYKYHTAWCSTTPQFSSLSPSWRHCKWDCDCYWKPMWNCAKQFNYKGVTFSGCTTVDHHGIGWCSLDAVFKGRWQACPRFCPRDNDDFTPIPKPSTHSATNCTWLPPAASDLQQGQPPCVFPFTFKGKTYTKCTYAYHTDAWCSLDATYVGRFAHCDWKCQPPVQCHYAAPVDCKQNFAYDGRLFSGCVAQDAQHSKPWCSIDATYQGNFKECSWYCPCYWVPHPDCSTTWSLGTGPESSHTGCAVTGGKGWCSTTSKFSGHYRWCSWACVERTGSGAGARFPWEMAGIGAGAGAGAAGVGLGIWGIVEATSRRRGKLPNAGAQQAALQAMQDGSALEAPAGARRLSDYMTRGAAFGWSQQLPFLLTVLMIVSLCTFSAIGTYLMARRRSKSRRVEDDAEEGIQLVE